MSEPEKTVERSLLSPANIITAVIILGGLWITYLRFTGGLGAVTNLDDNNAWGIWISFDLLCGVALAAGGYTTAAAVEVFGMKKFHAALRPALLTGFLGYSLVVIALLYDVGRPWRLPYPFVWSPGPTSVLFEVGACVMLYLLVLFLEFSPMALTRTRRSFFSPSHSRAIGENSRKSTTRYSMTQAPTSKSTEVGPGLQTNG